MAAKKRIVISGYYGFDNTGDEAVLYAIIRAIKQECQGHQIEITVLSNQPEKTRELYKVKAINRWDMRQVYKSVRQCDILISGGGSLLQDVTSNKTVPYYLLIIKMAQWHKKEVIFYSQGYGPVNKGYNKYLVKQVLNKINYIFVRDYNSKKSLLDIGVTKAQIIVAADPVIGMDTNEKSRLKMEKYISSYSTDKKRVGIYLRSWKNDSEIIEKMNLLCKILEKENLDIFFIPMQEPDDHKFLDRIKLPNKSTYKVNDNLDIHETFALTGQMDVVVGMRLHALIMATAQEIATVGLAYDPKVNDFMKTIDNKHCYDVEAFDVNDLANSIIGKVSQLESEKKDIKEKKNLLLDKVYQPAKLVNKILT